jgi:Na+/proline symporter
MIFGPRFTPEELEARLKFFAGFVLILVFGAAMLAIVWSLIFNTQPMKDIAPADRQFFELLKTMVTFLAGVISTVVTNRLVTKKEDEPTPLPAPTQDPKPESADGQAT